MYALNQQEHQYACTTPEDYKRKFLEAQETIRELERHCRNTSVREKRAKSKSKGLLGELRQQKLLCAELETKLQLYSG